MINLQDVSGLPLLFNTQDNSLQPTGEVGFEMLEKVRLDMLRPILLNRTLRYPLHVYSEYYDICLSKHEEIFNKTKLHFSLIVLPSGLLGVEYNKTHIFAPDQDQNDIAAIAEILYGKGILFMQKVKEKGEYDFDTEVLFSGMFKVKRGDRIPIPQKYMYTFINPGNAPLIVARTFEDDGKIDYRTLRREQGMSYYFIRKNARREVVRNPHYKDIPPLKRLKCDNYCSKFRLTASKPIYTQIVQNPDRFAKMLV